MKRGLLKHIDIICYINLSHRKDRKNHILSELNKLDIPKQKIIRIEAVQDCMNGHRGCAQSHILALEEVQRRGGTALILEDDCQFIVAPDEMYSLCNYFFSKLGDDWDVFMLGGYVRNYSRTKYDAVYRVLHCFGGHAYCVHPNYISTLLSCFKTSLEQMQGDLFSFESLPYAIDRKWKELQERDRWFMTKMMAHQMDSYSDIEWRFRRWGKFLRFNISHGEI